MNNFGAGRQRHVVLAAAVAMLVAGCSGGAAPTTTSSSNMPAPSQPPSAPTSSEPDQRQAVEAAYTQFWPRSLAIPSTPEATWQAAMAKLAVDPQLSTTLAGMRRNKQVGVKPYGDVTTHISSVEVHGGKATVIDCQDGSRSGQADAATGDRKTVGTPQIPIHARMSRDASDGQWKVAELAYPGGPC
ncbi:hypothetical protein [Amycolatopsis sp. NPDC004079]|uniref:hypothetical protein n=1 Tax=Amycolatopsis sp. NPDC004079 TaxID=3154549 RepID=UPI0033AE3736